MSINRRDFLKAGSVVSSGIFLSRFTNLKELAALDTEATRKLKQFGLQLYTLRDDMSKDPKSTLQKVASYGFKQIEGFEGPQGMFWGMTNKDFKKFLDSLGMTMISSHCNINQDFERKAAEAGEIGMRYLICPHFGAPKTLDAYKKGAGTFNQRGEVCKKNGMRFAYHNHDYSFKPVEGVLPQDTFMQNTDPALVDFEMDAYWVVTAGQNPVDWLKRYPARFRLMHVKDRKKDVASTETNAFAVLGTGQIDYATLIKEGRKYGVHYFISEQDQSYNQPPLEAAKENAEYLKKVKF